MILPSSHRYTVAFLLLLLAAAVPSFAQDTRGSLVPDGKVALADGKTIEAQDLKVGMLVWAWLATGKPGAAKVTGVRRQHTDSFILIKAGTLEFRANGSHRIALAGGKLVRLDSVKLGDAIWAWSAQGPLVVTVTSLRLYPANLVAYDLTLEGHLPFAVDGIVVGD